MEDTIGVKSAVGNEAVDVEMPCKKITEGLGGEDENFSSLCFFYFEFNDVVEGTVLAELTRRRSQTLRSSSMM